MAADLKTKRGLVIYSGLNVKRLYRKRDLHNAKRPTVCAFITNKNGRAVFFLMNSASQKKNILHNKNSSAFNC